MTPEHLHLVLVSLLESLSFERELGRLMQEAQKVLSTQFEEHPIGSGGGGGQQ